MIVTTAENGSALNDMSIRKKKPKVYYGHRYYRFNQAKVNGLWYVLLRRCQKKGWKGTVNGTRGGARTYAMQAYLFMLFKTGRGAPAFAPNGPSRHLRRNIGRGKRWKQAVDVSDPQGLIKAAARLNPPVRLHTPYPHEPWHVEAVEPFSFSSVKR